MKRATVKQQAEAYAIKNDSVFNARWVACKLAYLAGYRAAQRAARKTQKGKTK